MKNNRTTGLISALAILVMPAVAGGTTAWAAEPSQYDIGYFTDADQLVPPSDPVVPGIVPARMPISKRAFCSRTQQGIAAPFRADADRLEALNLKVDTLGQRFTDLSACVVAHHGDSSASREFYALAQQMSDINNQISNLHDIKMQDSLYGMDNISVTDRRRLLQSYPETLAFKNPDGTFNTGLCWFHSRFQRASLYLSNFRPELPKPTPYQAKQIISDLIKMGKVVDIPGFRGLHEFSEAYREQIISALDRWSVVTAPLLLQRLGDKEREENPQQVRQTLETLYHRVQDSGEIQFVRFNIGGDPFGFHSHANLVLKAEPVWDQVRVDEPGDGWVPRLAGYRFLTIDSLTPNIPRWRAVRFTDSSQRLAISHVDYDGDLVSIEQALRDYCL